MEEEEKEGKCFLWKWISYNLGRRRRKKGKKKFGGERKNPANMRSNFENLVVRLSDILYLEV